MRIIIIEDEALTASDLAATIKKADSRTEIAAILGSVGEAVDYFRKHPDEADLIFSDIQLGDGLSFEIFQQTSINTPIIFCTAYDEYALNAFKVSSIHYMLKPFSVKTVGEALQKFHTLRSSLTHKLTQYETMLEILNKRKKQGSILVYRGEKILPVSLDDIALCFIEHDTCHILTFGQNKYVINKSLEEVESIAGDSFFRANRQFLVNRKAVKDSTQYFARKLVINLNIPFEEKITVSKAKSGIFLDWLSK